MENRGGLSDQEKIEWAAKETERRIKKAAEAKERGEQTPDFEPIDLENIGEDAVELSDADLNKTADEEWAEASKKEAAEAAELEAEHEKAVEDLDRDIELSVLEGKMEQIELEASEEAKRAEIAAEEQRQMEEARQKMETEMKEEAYEKEVADEASATAKHELMGEEVMSDAEMAVRERLAAEALEKDEADKKAVKEFNALPASRAESGTTVSSGESVPQPDETETPAVIDPKSPEAMIKDAEEKLADIAAEMIAKREHLQALERQGAAPDDASHVFKIETLQKEIADLQAADRSLRDTYGIEPAAETPKEEISADIEKAEIKEGGLEFTTEEKAFFDRGESMSASNEHRREVLNNRLTEITEKYNALQAKVNQASSKKSLFGGLWSGIKNALGRGDERKLRQLAEQRDDLQEQLGILETEREAPLTPERPSEYQAGRREARKTTIMMDKMKGDR